MVSVGRRELRRTQDITRRFSWQLAICVWKSSPERGTLYATAEFVPGCDKPSVCAPRYVPDLYGPIEVDNALSTALGTETLADRDMVPPLASKTLPADTLPIEIFKHRRFLWALDTFSIPAMSAECERVFSSAKKLITPERNALANDTIEACECLKAW